MLDSGKKIQHSKWTSKKSASLFQTKYIYGFEIWERILYVMNYKNFVEIKNK